MRFEFPLRSCVYLISFILTVCTVSFSYYAVQAQDAEFGKTRFALFEPESNVFLVNDPKFYMSLSLDGDERAKAEKRVNHLFNQKGGLCLGITRTTALAFEQNTMKKWFLEYDKENPDRCFAYERAFAIGYYNVSSFGLTTNGIPGNTMWSKFVVDPSGSLFRTIVNQHGSPQLLERAYALMIKSFPNSGKHNFKEAKRILSKVEAGHPWPVGFFTADLMTAHAVLAYAVVGENHLRDNELSIVLAVWDPNNIRDYYSSDDAEFSTDDYDYIEIAPSGDLSVSLVETPSDFYKYLVFDSQYDPNCSDLTDNLSESLMNQAEAMGKSWG